MDGHPAMVMPMGHKAKQSRGLVSLRTAVVVLLGLLAGTAVGWWTATARQSMTEGLLAGTAAGAATIQFFHTMIETDHP